MTPYDTHASVALAPAPADTGAHASEQMETRFGTLSIKPEHKLEMPKGPFGFAGYTQFALADVPSQAARQFRILQSLESADVSFIVLPVSGENKWIDGQDFKAACASYCFDPATSGLLLIATMRRGADGQVQTTVNLKAPIVLDTAHQLARQVVFTDADYTIQHPLDL
jgi:flagellar assembly factor FliW